MILNNKNILLAGSCILYNLAFDVSALEFDVQYNSKYVSEGRNNLSTGGIYWIAASENLHENLSATIAYGYASSTDIDYDELNVTAEYTNSFNEIDWYISYNRLEFFKDDQNDNELALGFEYAGLESFTPFSNVIYSTQASGHYFESGVRREIDISPLIKFEGYVLAAFDYGYISELHHGYNHAAVGGQFNFDVFETLSIYLSFELNRAGTDIEINEGNKESQNWLGVGFNKSFD